MHLHSIVRLTAPAFDALRSGRTVGHVRDQLHDDVAALRAVGESSGRELFEAAAALKRLQREEIELRLAIKRRETVPVQLLQVTIARGARRAGAILSTIVATMRRRWPDITTEHLAVIDSEIVRARNEVASMSIDDVLNDDHAGGGGG